MIETGGAPTELRVLEAMPEVPQQAGTQGEPAAPAEDAIPERQVAEQAPEQPIPQMAEAEEQPRETSAISAMPPDDPGARRPALGKVVIRRGDTLWSIADRVYGSGYRYRTIYRANKDQIRNPRWIYPGQVLEIPLVLDEE